MATYEIGDASARIIWRALDFTRRCDPAAPDLTELLELFAPPEPPTAAELAEALRGVVEYRRQQYLDLKNTPAYARAVETLARWEASNP